MKTNKKQAEKKVDMKNIVKKTETAFSARKKDGITSDVLGSYTGAPLDGEQPVQDADDL